MERPEKHNGSDAVAVAQPVAIGPATPSNENKTQNNVRGETTPSDEAAEQISHLSEHAESLGNSFQALTAQLLSREQQLIHISTQNAHLQAENDETKGQNEFFKQQMEKFQGVDRKIETTFANLMHFNVLSTSGKF